MVATHTGATRYSQEIKALATLSISQLMISTIKQRAFVWHPTAARIEEPREAKVPAKQRQIGCCRTNVRTSSKLPRFVEQTLRAPPRCSAGRCFRDNGAPRPAPSTVACPRHHRGAPAHRLDELPEQGLHRLERVGHVAPSLYGCKFANPTSIEL